MSAPSPLSRLARRVGGRPWFARVGRAFVPLDRLVGRLTRGRFVALGLKELPSLIITTSGRQTGRPRSNPLLYVRDGDAFIVIGSNWGQAHHPAWSGNLLAHPTATVTLAGRTVNVTASLAGGAERERLRQLLLRTWPAYTDYEQRAAGRTLRIFRLEPQGQVGRSV